MKKNINLIVLLLAGVILFAGWTAGGVEEPKFDHSPWDRLLQTHVSEKGNVNYDGFKTEEAKLDSYLETLAQKGPSSDWGRMDVMAFWINAYNAFTVKLILDNYPTTSIMNINGGKAWDLKFIKIGGKEYSLNNIEHDILRRNYRDPRIHFAVNCASISCPKLNNRAFIAAELNRQLVKMTKEFLGNTSKNTLSPNSVEISSLFDWYKNDFNGGDVIGFINKYADQKVATNATITYKVYNWNLNK